MNRVQRLALFALCSAAVLPALPSGAAVMTIDTTEPTGPDVVASRPHSTGTSTTPGPAGERDTFTTVNPDNGGARGQTFFIPDNSTGPAFDLSAVTIRANANAAGAGVAQDLTVGGPNTLTLWVFQWNPVNDANDGSQWTTGDGVSDGDAFDNTGITNFLVNGETFDITRQFNGEFIHFALPPGVQLAENTAYGLLASFESAGTTGFQLDQVRDPTVPTGEGYVNGAEIRGNTGDNTINQNNDDLVFYVEAVPVPEPTTAALALTGLACLTSRRARRSY